MDRETPFGADEIYWTHFVTERDRQRGQLLVQLLLVPRASLAPLLGALADFGITPKRAEIAARKNQNCYLPLDAHGGRLHHGAPSTRLLRWAAGTLCASLAVATVGIPLACQSSGLAQL